MKNVAMALMICVLFILTGCVAEERNEFTPYAGVREDVPFCSAPTPTVVPQKVVHISSCSLSREAEYAAIKELRNCGWVVTKDRVPLDMKISKRRIGDKIICTVVVYHNKEIYAQSAGEAKDWTRNFSLDGKWGNNKEAIARMNAEIEAAQQAIRSLPYR
jgi:hypothetical protein